MNQGKLVKVLLVVLLFALLLPAGAFAQMTIRTMTIQNDGVDVNRRILYLDFNESKSFDIVTTPDLTLANTDIIVKSSNERIATVEYDGSDLFTVYANDTAGNVTITVQDRVSRKSAYVRLYVQKLTESIVYFGEDTEVEAGRNIRLYAEAFPEEASNRRLLWYAYESGCNPSDLSSCTASRAASVTSTGVVTGRQVDADTDVDIVICPSDGGAECEIYPVTVKPALRRLVIRDQNGNDVTSKTVYLNLTDSANLTVEADPQSIILDSDKITYKSANKNIIDAEGTGTSIFVSSGDKGGSTSILVRDERSGKTASVRVNVQVLSSQIILDPNNETEVKSGKSITLKASVDPTNAANKNLLWYVFDSCENLDDLSSCAPTNAAFIGRNGVLTARPVDEATQVTVVTCPADGKAQCVESQVEIQPVIRDILVKDADGKTITNADVVSLVAGEPFPLEAEPVPNSIPDTYTWMSSNTRVATVESYGTTQALVTGHMKGSATITVFSDSVRVRKTIKVRVIGQLAESIEVTPSTVDYELVDGKSVTLRAVVTPQNADIRTVKWTIACEDESLCTNGIPATVVNGRVTATHVTQRTTVRVCAEPMDGSNVAPACVLIDVAPKARALRIVDRESLAETLELSSSLTIPNWGDTYHFHAPDLTDVKAPIIKMLNTEQKFINLVALLDFGNGEFEIGTRNNIAWSSSNRRIADVDSNGVVTFYQSGTVTIFARTTDGSNLSRSATVTAQYQVEKITIFSPNDSHVLGAGRSMQLTAKVEPQTATNARLRWYIDPVMSTRLAAATINESTGRITAAEVTREEHITVIAEATDVDVRNQNIARGTFEITIFPLVKSMDIYCEDEIVSGTTVYADVNNDTTLQLYPVAYPVNLVAQDVTWSSSNTRVAEVDKNGLVRIKDLMGSTVIRAVAKDGSNVSAAFTLQVVIKTNSISILEPPISRLEPISSVDGVLRYYRLRAGTSATITARPDDSKVTNQNAKWYVDDINGIPGINFRYNAALGYALGPNFTFTGLDVSERVCSVITAVADDAIGSFEMGTIPATLYDQIGVCVFPTVKAVKIYRPTGAAGAGKDITGQTFYMDLGDTLTIGQDISNIYAQNYPLAAYQGNWAWATSNQSILSYDGDKTFTALREGTINLTARALDGTNLTASIRVNVVDFDKLTDDQRTALLWSEDLYLGDSFAYQWVTFSMASVDTASGALASAASEENADTASLDVLTASAIDNGDIDSLVTLLLMEAPAETSSDAEVSGEVESDNETQTESVENGEEQVSSEIQESENAVLADVTVTEENTEEFVAVEPTETPVIEQQVEATAQPEGEATAEVSAETIEENNEQQEQSGLSETGSEDNQVTNETQPVTDENNTAADETQESAEESVPAVEAIVVDVEDDLITLTYGQTFTLESWKLSVLPAEADWNTLTFAFEDEYIAELESEELAKIREEGLKIKGLAEGETILIIKSGEVEKKIRVIVQPVPVVETTPEVVENVESSAEVSAENQAEVNITNETDQLTDVQSGSSSERTIEQENTGDDSVSSDVTETSVEQPAEEQVTDEPETESAAE